MVLGMLGAAKWADYQQKVREYDACTGRVERSIELYKFNNALVDVVNKEVANRPDISDELRKAVLKPLSLSDCPDNPNFLIGYSIN